MLCTQRGIIIMLGHPTVQTHVRQIYEKLHVRSRAEAVARFVGR